MRPEMSNYTIEFRGTYQTWQDMKQRCYNQNNHNYHRYGARGIAVCKPWMQFENFLRDMGERPEGLTLERLDSNGHYTPENCRWATRAEQGRNREGCVHLEYDGKRMTVEEWGREIGKHPTTIRLRIKSGYPLHLVLYPGDLPSGYTARNARGKNG